MQESLNGSFASHALIIDIIRNSLSCVRQTIAQDPLCVSRFLKLSAMVHPNMIRIQEKRENSW